MSASLESFASRSGVHSGVTNGFVSRLIAPLLPSLFVFLPLLIAATLDLDLVYFRFGCEGAISQGLNAELVVKVILFNQFRQPLVFSIFSEISPCTLNENILYFQLLGAFANQSGENRWPSLSKPRY